MTCGGFPAAAPTYVETVVAQQRGLMIESTAALLLARVVVRRPTEINKVDRLHGGLYAAPQQTPTVETDDNRITTDATISRI